MNNRSILITGGCGFIGTSLIRKLLAEFPDIKIRVVDNLSVGKESDLAKVANYKKLKIDEAFDKDTSQVALVEADIRNLNDMILCSRGVDSIVHLAANTGVGPSVLDPVHDMESNVVGTLNMLEASRGNDVSKFIFASSGAPAGQVEPPIHEEMPPHPVSPYGASKLAGEGYCSAYFQTFKIDTVCLRFGNVYGPGSGKKSSVVAKFIKQAIAGEVCEIYGDGKQTRDFIYIDDLTTAIVTSLKKENIGGEIFQIATGLEQTVYEIAVMIQKALKDHDIEMVIGYSGARLGDVTRNFSDVRKAKNVLGWESAMDIETGIRSAVTDFMS